ncbi:O-antigen ligase domain-containing protein [Halieaceae bacterium IMCC14734]|uniref:O-antigen ligase domain-containing protein n=1 Tax=Candidatus Litorirhabdus singularis TaxID=2518993 RepID=A0ABT3TK01_9GAMM|nr:O-antigen ligase family protein [Candidatus Litorirhabdus singularis]MCX2982611.1 O-antigen ligase domain-containing protein [Candidatus Litorirhabdus singularis]
MNEKLAWLLAVILGGVFLLPMAFDVLLGIALLAVLIQYSELHAPVLRVLKDPLYLCALALLLYLSASVLWSANISPKGVAQLWLRMLFVMVFVLGLAVAHQRTSITLLRACQVVAIAALLCALLSLILFYMYPPADSRLEGPFRLENPGRIGRMLAVALLFAITLFQLERGRWRWLAALSFVVCSMALINTGTRSAWLAAVFGIFCWLLVSWHPKLNKAVAVAGVGSVLLALLLYVMTYHPELSAQLFPRGDSFRMSIWQANLRDILDGHVWFGWGQLVEHRVEMGGYLFRGTHNMFLAMLAAGGLPALVMFCVVLGWTGLRLVRHAGGAAATLGLVLLIAGVAGFLFNGDRIIDKVNFVWFVVWVPLGFAIGLSQQSTLDDSN